MKTKFFLLLLAAFALVVASEKRRLEDENEEKEQVEEQVEEYQQEVVVKQPKVKTVVDVDKTYPPEVTLISPKQRKLSNFTLLSTPPCGGSEKGNVHFVTTPGSRNFIAWKVLHPSPTGNCTIRVGNGADEDAFTVLIPLDNSANDKGSFPCGRQEAVIEGKDVRFPSNYTCDSCTLQWEWTTELGQIHTCADVTIINKEIEECSGKCQNGGICSNGECKCRRNYSGAFCQYKDINQSNILYYLMLFLVLIVIIGGLFYASFIMIKHVGERQKQMARANMQDITSDKSGEPNRGSRFDKKEETKQY